MYVRLALSEAALRLIRHASNDIPSYMAPGKQVGRILGRPLGATTSPSQWLPEAATLRLTSVIEAYVDAVSMHRMGTLVDSSAVLVNKMLDDFERTSSRTWQERHDTYENYHRFSLKSRRSWDAISAGIEVRNCLAHGLGRLTAQQRSKTSLPTTVARIDVTVAGNRMRLSAATVRKLGAGCDDFIRDVDSSIDLINP